jgi:hypothetical protein
MADFVLIKQLKGRDIMMMINDVVKPHVSFGKKSDLIISHDRRNVQKLQKLNDMLGKIIKDIGGINDYSTFDANVIKAQEKIEQLRKETIDAWGTCPSALKPKLQRLDQMQDQLTAIQEAYKKINKDIDEETPGLIVPGQSKESKDKKGDKILTDTMDIMALYNSLPKNGEDIKRLFAEKGSAREVKTSNLTSTELKGALSEMEKPQWDFAKLNAQDAAIYPKLQNQLLVGDIKQIIDDQVKLIDKKLSELKENNGKMVPAVGVKVFGPETTGKIMALETAKLRRTTLQESILMPGVIENLDKPDVMLQPVPYAAPEAFKIDKTHVPSKQEIMEILELNKPYKPVLNKLFPDGLNLYVVPGYFDSKSGDIEGGMCIPGQPDAGVWLNSYDNEMRHQYFTMLEKQTALLREVDIKQTSTLRGNKDRARALAHEIGHVISYKIEENEKASQPAEKSSSIVLSSADGVGFIDAWKSLRMGAELNGHENHKNETRGLSEANLKNLRMAIDLEMIAEDIRIAMTDQNLPAASRLTGIQDQTETGQKQLANVKAYIKECLLEDKQPTEAMLKYVAGAR